MRIPGVHHADIFRALHFPSQPLLLKVLRRPIEITQYVSIRYGERLATSWGRTLGRQQGCQL